jgi:hypothetical protein
MEAESMVAGLRELEPMGRPQELAWSFPGVFATASTPGRGDGGAIVRKHKLPAEEGPTTLGRSTCLFVTSKPPGTPRQPPKTWSRLS